MIEDYAYHRIKGVAPFNGITLHLKQASTIDIVCSILTITIGELITNTQTDVMLHAEDWLEIDDYTTPGYATNWQELQSWVKSSDLLSDRCPKRAGVKQGVVDLNGIFYIRFGRNTGGQYSIDVCLTKELADQIQAIVSQRLGDVCELLDTRQYLDSIASNKSWVD